VWSLKRWGSPLVQEKYREEKACDKRHPYNDDDDEDNNNTINGLCLELLVLNYFFCHLYTMSRSILGPIQSIQYRCQGIRAAKQYKDHSPPPRATLWGSDSPLRHLYCVLFNQEQGLYHYVSN
jgi:hypothetical protein